MSGRERHSSGMNTPHNTVPRAKESRKKELRADFLLNWNQRPPSHQRPQHYAPPQRRSRPNAYRSPASFAKGRFVQSSFRIMVDEVTPDVVEATLNADVLLDWASVRRVDLQGEEPLKCPICLEEHMVVPKITKCGHVFCLACVMRYFLALQETTGRFFQKCPVCNTQQVSPEELISVRFEPLKKPREGERMRFLLARRAATSTVVRPPPRASSGSGGPPRQASKAAGKAPLDLPVEGEDGWHLSRLSMLPPGRYHRMLTQELETLSAFRAASLASGDTELLPSIDEASRFLEQVRSHHVPGEQEIAPDAGAELEDFELEPGRQGSCEQPELVSPGSRPDEAVDGSWDGPEASGSQAASSAAVPRIPGVQASTPPLTPSMSSAPGQGSTGAGSSDGGALAKGCPSHLISFYMADDGRLVFLQPLFTRLLLHEHGGTWDGLPLELPETRVERLQEATITEETRKRHKFLSHLPVGTEICWAEIDTRSMISQETKEHFAEDFTKLREQRKKDQQKSRREDRLSKSRAERTEEEYYRSVNRIPPSAVVFQPLPTKEDFVPLPGRSGADAVGHEDAPAGDADAASGSGDLEEETGPTLAERLKERMAAKAKPGAGKKRPVAKAAAPSPDMDNESLFPTLGGGGGKASSSSAPAAPVPKEAPVIHSEPVKDSWDDDTPPASPALVPSWGPAAARGAPARETAPGPTTPMDEQVTLGDALDQVLRTRTGSEDAAEAAAEAGPETAAAGDQGSRKKKGKAKAKTIRLFG